MPVSEQLRTGGEERDLHPIELEQGHEGHLVGQDDDGWVLGQVAVLKMRIQITNVGYFQQRLLEEQMGPARPQVIGVIIAYCGGASLLEGCQGTRQLLRNHAVDASGRRNEHFSTGGVVSISDVAAQVWQELHILDTGEVANIFL